MTVELKNDLSITGVLRSVDQYVVLRTPHEVLHETYTPIIVTDS